ncbi:hypothetical protein DBV15_09862 [Temnothorax longispinosus]|uniref:Uncharacterized protein n=1 Tax=Temnothorax longispinosus TaxID=300112 RepID=A0A4S2L2Z3_9HYME|nr:hypothetical protein DBV15_09862 [Temnothorax longispinosus]
MWEEEERVRGCGENIYISTDATGANSERIMKLRNCKIAREPGRDSTRENCSSSPRRLTIFGDLAY